MAFAMDYRRRVASLANETSVVSVISGGVRRHSMLASA